MADQLISRPLSQISGFTIAVLMSGSALADPVIVTNGNDSGTGSLRAALESGAREVVIATEDDIMTTATLTYAGEESLAIMAMGKLSWRREITRFSKSAKVRASRQSVSILWDREDLT